eukprot:CAMPEP_0198144364 /NCGR_PEP_ID=MMETSP1443-20131203/14982_1 /TAXON_ID=186043 /ORGANISM="Entomoneis sp., Strain CCMP2396" /LENGTH=192 /DNA_ID=CAMNT_0043807745 /DNA_START=73 /DNA_END=648 /DNA_ORIENTATION=-
MTKYLVLFLNLLFASNLTAVLAWQFQSPEPPSKTLSRRSFLVQVPVATATCISGSIILSSNPLPAVAAITSAAAKDQWTKSLVVIDNLLSNWSANKGGDSIRVELGTQGTTSPLFQIEKALKVLREDIDDIVEFTELSEEFQLTLARADSMAYSANFAGGAGKPTPPAVYIEKAKKEVESLQKIAKELGSLI